MVMCRMGRVVQRRGDGARDVEGDDGAREVGDVERGDDGVRVVVDPLFWPAGQVEAGGCFFLLGLHPKTL